MSTLLDQGPAAGRTAAGPTARSVARSSRGPLLLLLTLVLTAVLAAVLSVPGGAGLLDPDAYEPTGAHATAVLLRDAGVPVMRVVTVEAAAQGAGPATTVFVPLPSLLSQDELARLAQLPGELVLVGAGPDELEAVGADADAQQGPKVEPRRPACDLPAAVRAGDALLGGVDYAPTGTTAATGCYALGGRATLLRLPGHRLTLVGAGDLFTNERLARRGDAALALGLLGAGDEVRWLVPDPDRPVAGGDTRESPGALLSTGVRRSALQVFVALAVLALWRARRLGRVVPEPLPVVVRAAEAVEGRSRLYRAAGARGRAAEQLRAGTRDRLARRLGRAPDGVRPALVEEVARRARRDPAGVDTLLYGAAPADDAALVRLADELDSLTREVAGS